MAAVRKPFSILVEGNIGVGKSTFLKQFERNMNIEIIYEPIEMWRDLNGSNILDLMYQDTQKWGFPFQSYTTLLMLKNHEKPTEKKIKMMERSVFSGRYCFTKLLLEDGKLTKEEYDILHKWYDFIEENNDVRPDLIVYLRATPEQVHERLQSRRRSEEAKISFDYIQRLHKLHDDWLVHKIYNNNNNNSVPVLILDANLNANQVQAEYEKYLTNTTI